MSLPLRSKWSASPFDTQIRSRKGRRVTLSLSLGALYDTVIRGTVPFTVEILPGVYDPLTASPRAGGKRLKRSAQQVDGQWRVRLGSREMDSAGFFLGYPTNFSKNGGENYYHVLHYVALSLLVEELNKPELDGLAGTKVLDTCLRWADKWQRYTNAKKHEGRRFPNADDVRESTLTGSAFAP